jgi:hypothetical protein
MVVTIKRNGSITFRTIKALFGGVHGLALADVPALAFRQLKVINKVE